MRAPAPTPTRVFKQPRLAIVGCGDVGLRIVHELAHRAGGRWRVIALTSSAQRCAALRAAGIVPIVGDLDQPTSLRRLAALSPWWMHLAPPPAAGPQDTRTRALLAALSRSPVTTRLVYASTTGVYGDAGGARFDETRPVRPGTDRARRRVDAEQQVRLWAGRTGRQACVLRIPGIYASNRVGGHPRERLLKGTPVLQAADDVYTNHIHADDLARIALAALWRGKPHRVYHASDDTDLRMGEYFDLAARLCNLPPPPRVSRAQARQQLSPMQMSFMSESRRLLNHRIKRELGVVLRHSTVAEGLRFG